MQKITLAGALYGTRFAQSLLYDVNPTDPLLFGAAALLLALVALAATWIPARRAGRLDPVEVLRADA